MLCFTIWSILNVSWPNDKPCASKIFRLVSNRRVTNGGEVVILLFAPLPCSRLSISCQEAEKYVNPFLSFPSTIKTAAQPQQPPLRKDDIGLDRGWVGQPIKRESWNCCLYICQRWNWDQNPSIMQAQMDVAPWCLKWDGIGQWVVVDSFRFPIFNSRCCWCVEPCGPMWTHVDPGRPKWTQVDPSWPKWTQVGTSGYNRSHVEPSSLSLIS